MDNEAIIQFLKEVDEDFRVKGNVIHAEKAFMIRSVINWCLEQKEAGTMSDDQVQAYAKMINEYADGNVILFWDSPGRLGATKVQKNKEHKDDEE